MSAGEQVPANAKPPKTQKQIERELLKKLDRRANRVELVVTFAPLVLLAIGCGLVYLPLGLIVPAALWWADMADDRRPPTSGSSDP